MDEAPENLQDYLREKLTEPGDNLYLDEWISGHLDYSEQKRVRFITGHLPAFVNDK